MTADWTAGEIAAFGRLLGLSSLALDVRGRTAVRFENGFTLRLELVGSALWVVLALPLPAEPETLARLLSEAHPARRASAADAAMPRVRAAYGERTGEGLLTVRLERDGIEASRIDAAFRGLFERALAVGRAA